MAPVSVTYSLRVVLTCVLESHCLLHFSYLYARPSEPVRLVRPWPYHFLSFCLEKFDINPQFMIQQLSQHTLLFGYAMCAVSACIFVSRWGQHAACQSTSCMHKTCWGVAFNIVPQMRLTTKVFLLPALRIEGFHCIIQTNNVIARIYMYILPKVGRVLNALYHIYLNSSCSYY